MSTFTTENRHGYSVQFSPNNANRLVVASSQLYGLAGGGTLFHLEIDKDSNLSEICQFEWTDGLFDVVYCKQYEDIVATSSGDGSLQIWNLRNNEKHSKPLLCLKEHQNEVYSVDWNEYILSASWDGSIKLWDPSRSKTLSTFTGHSDLIYSSKFSPYIPSIFSSVSIDGTLNLWDFLDFSGKPFGSVNAHSGEILTCDWSKFDKNLLATGASDGLIRGWDIRKLVDPIFELEGCEYAVRRIKFSPFMPSMIVSANYDFTTRIFDYAEKEDALEIFNHHTEFVCGVDWNSSNCSQIVDCGWDSLVCRQNIEHV